MKDEDFEGLLTECRANMSIQMPPTEYSRLYNDGISKCIRFIQAYRDGKGLFQSKPKKLRHEIHCTISDQDIRTCNCGFEEERVAQ